MAPDHSPAPTRTFTSFKSSGVEALDRHGKQRIDVKPSTTTDFSRSSPVSAFTVEALSFVERIPRYHVVDLPR
jgi:hypothetical protein